MQEELDLALQTHPTSKTATSPINWNHVQAEMAMNRLQSLAVPIFDHRMMNEERNPLVFSLVKFTKMVFPMLVYLPKALY